MTPSYLVDTNLLVYGFDDREPEKQKRALKLLDRVGLGEFANVMLYKMEPPLPPREVYEQIQLHEKVFPTYPMTPAVSLEAVRTVEEPSFRYFDAQIWATAKLNQVPIVLSEDFPVGATVEGVTFENPLVEEFDLGEL